MIGRVLGVIAAIGLALFIIVGWILYGHPLGFVSLLLCDLLNLTSVC